MKISSQKYSILVIGVVLLIGYMFVNTPTTKDTPIVTSELSEQIQYNLEFYQDFLNGISDFEKYSDSDVKQIIERGLDDDNEESRIALHSSVAFEAIRHFHTKNPGYISGQFFTKEGESKTRDLSNSDKLKAYYIGAIKDGLENGNWKGGYPPPSWWYGYTALSVYYPGDEEIEELIFSGINKYPEMQNGFLQFIIYGEFTSDRSINLLKEALQSADEVVAKKAAFAIARLGSG
jgi:hypothetical protein